MLRTRSLQRLRTRKFHTLAEMFRLYNAHILSFVESRTAGLHHAAPSVLQVIDRIQRRFLSEVHVSERDALLKWRLAPLRCRRDIAMLGLLYRVAWNIAPADIAALFPWKPAAASVRTTRGTIRRHPYQFVEPIARGGHTDVFSRSCFGLTVVWNMLPTDVADLPSAKRFQGVLQRTLARRAADHTDFQNFFADAKRMTVQVFQSHFS